MKLVFPDEWQIGVCDCFQASDNSLWILTDALRKGDSRARSILFRFDPANPTPAIPIPLSTDGHSAKGQINHYGQLRITFTDWNRSIHTDIIQGFQAPAIQGPLSAGSPFVIQDGARQDQIDRSIKGLREDLQEVVALVPTPEQIKKIAYHQAENCINELFGRWCAGSDVRLQNFVHNFVSHMLKELGLIMSWVPRLPGWTPENPFRRK